MSKKMKNEHNPFLMVIYIAAVVAVIVGLFFMYRHSAKREEEYQALVEELKQTEDPNLEQNSWVTADEAQEAESSDDEEAGTEESETAGQGNKENPEASAEEVPEATVTPTVTPTVLADLNLSVVVLNGTGKEGVAAQWTETLKNSGYVNTIPATYSGTVEEQTVIYAAREEQGAQFLELFPNGVVRVGTVNTQGIITGVGVNLPTQVDVYIVVGKSETVIQ